MAILGWIVFGLNFPCVCLALAMRLYHSFFAPGAPGSRRFNSRCVRAAFIFGLCAGGGLIIALSP